MPKVSIERFRSALASCAEHGPSMLAYRELARRPAAALLLVADWPVWNDAAAAVRG